MQRRIGHVHTAALLGGAVALAAVAGPLTSGAIAATTPSRPAAAITSPSTLVTAVKAALGVARSVHIETSNYQSGKTEQVTTDAGRGKGHETYVIGAAEATVVVTAQAAFFAGNASGLSTIFGMPKDDITKVGSKWVEAKAGTKPYSLLKQGVFETAISGELLPNAAETKLARLTTVHTAGTSVYSLSWKASETGGVVTETLEVADGGAALPVQAKLVQGKNHSLTRFTSWGETIRLSAPKHLIDFSKLSA